MAENKTKPTGLSVTGYLNAIEDEDRRRDCKELVKIFKRVTKSDAKMWGTAIVGFGSYHYKYESGREGDACLTGFSSRKGEIAIYIMTGFESREPLLAKLGKHKTGKACLYVKSVSDIDVPVLEKLIRDSVAMMKSRYPENHA